MEGIVGWVVVGILGGIGAFSLVPLLVRGSLQWPAIQWAVLVVLGGVGACILMTGLVWIARCYRLTGSGGRVAEGRVVGQRKEFITITHNSRSRMDDDHFGDTNRSSWVRYYPIVEFRPEEGEAARMEGRVYGTGRPMLETGRVVRVFYDPRHPSSRAVLDTFYETWLRPLVVSGAGLILLVAGIWGYLASGRALAASQAEARSPEALERQTERDSQAARQYELRVQGTIDRFERADVTGPAQYRFVCKAVRPGEKQPEEFPSEAFPFEPGSGFGGRPVEIFFDREDPLIYYVPLGGLWEEMAGKAKALRFGDGR
jgi:hypothetical protein